MPDISDVTATGWVKDHILTKEIIKTLDATDEPDYIYTIRYRATVIIRQSRCLTIRRLQ